MQQTLFGMVIYLFIFAFASVFHYFFVLHFSFGFIFAHFSFADRTSFMIQAITGDSVLSKFEKVRSALVNSLRRVEDIVPQSIGCQVIMLLLKSILLHCILLEYIQVMSWYYWS